MSSPYPNPGVPPPGATGGPATSAAPDSAGDGPLRPSGWWYSLGAVLMVLGVGAGTALVVTSVASTFGAVDDFPRADVPWEGTSTTVLELDAGEHVVYAEYPYDPFRSFSADPGVRVFDADGDELVVRYRTGSTYDLGGRHGVAIGEVTVPVAGVHEVEVAARGSDAVTVAFGDDLVLDAVVGVFGGFGLAGIGVVGGLVALIVVGVKRGRDKRSRQAPTPQWPAGAPAGAWSGGPGATWSAAPPTGAGWSPPPGPAWPPPPSGPGWSPPPPPDPVWSPPQGPSPQGPPPPADGDRTGWTAPGGTGRPPG